MARNKVNKNSNGTDDGTVTHVTQDTPPAPTLPWDNGSRNRKRFPKFFQDFKTGIVGRRKKGHAGSVFPRPEKKLTDSFSYDTYKVLIEKVGIQNGGIAY